MTLLRGMAGLLRGNQALMRLPFTKSAGSVRPRAVRRYATARPTNESGMSRSTYAIFGVLGVILVGSASLRLGWELHKNHEGPSVLVERDFERFGTPDDFKKAIAQLKQELPADAVSTDGNVLKSHGFSANVSLSVSPFAVDIPLTFVCLFFCSSLITLAWHTPSLCSRIGPKTS